MREKFIIGSWWVLVGIWLLVAGNEFLLKENTENAIAWTLAFGVFALGWAAFLEWLFGIRRHMSRFTGVDLSKLEFLEKFVSASRLADLQRAMEATVPESSIRFGINKPTIEDLRATNSPVVPLRWSSVDLETGVFENYPTNAVYFTEFNGEKFFVKLSEESIGGGYYLDGEYVGGSTGTGLQVLASSIESGSAFINNLIAEGGKRSIYRGKLLHVTNESHATGTKIRVGSRSKIDLNDIVLPPSVIEVLERVVSTRIKHHKLLESHGHSVKTGVLLHGPPGTGKTLTSKYLVGSWDGYTAIAPTGRKRRQFAKYFDWQAICSPPSLLSKTWICSLNDERQTRM